MEISRREQGQGDRQEEHEGARAVLHWRVRCCERWGSGGSDLRAEGVCLQGIGLWQPGKQEAQGFAVHGLWWFPSKETTGDAGEYMLSSAGDRASSGAAAGLDQRLPGRGRMVSFEQGTVFNHKACIDFACQEKAHARDIGQFMGYVLSDSSDEDADPLQCKGHYFKNRFNHEGARPPGLGGGRVTFSPDTCFNHASTDALARWAWHDV